MPKSKKSKPPTIVAEDKVVKIMFKEGTDTMYILTKKGRLFRSGTDEDTFEPIWSELELPDL